MIAHLRCIGHSCGHSSSLPGKHISLYTYLHHLTYNTYSGGQYVYTARAQAQEAVAELDFDNMEKVYHSSE